MPAGYKFLGSQNEEFNRRFTLDHFELIDREKIDSFSQKNYDYYKPMLDKTIDELTDEELYTLGTFCETGKYEGKQVAYCMLHCFLCQKIDVDMSYIYCTPCEFNYRQYLKR